LLTFDCGTSTGSRLVQAAFGKSSIEGLTIEVMLRVASLQLEASADLSGRTLGVRLQRRSPRHPLSGLPDPLTSEQVLGRVGKRKQLLLAAGSEETFLEDNTQ
jgi:hypothetical protein